MQCPRCQTIVLPTDKFCPHCGFPLPTSVPSSPSVMKQAGVYVLSILLPPLGLLPGIKYLRSNDVLTKRVGMIAIVLTVLSTIFTLWATVVSWNYVNGLVHDQTQQYQSLGL